MRFLNRSIDIGRYDHDGGVRPPVPATFYTFPLHTPFEAPNIDTMAAWDLVHTWRRSLIFLARGLYTCSLVTLYLFISLVLCSGYRTARTTPPSRQQATLRKESTGSSPSSVAEEKPSTIPEAAYVDFGAPFDIPFDPRYHPRFANGQPLALNTQESARSLVIPKIVVQDFSSEDGLVRYKTPEYDPTHTLKRRRRPSASVGDYHATTAQPSFRIPPALGAPAVGGLRPLYLVDGLKYRRSNVFVQDVLAFPGRKRVLGDVVAKDGSFVIVGL